METGTASTAAAPQHQLRQRGPALVPGAVIVSFLVATGRWGSYFGVPQRSLYVTDLSLLVTLGLVWRYRSAFLLRASWAPLAPVIALLGWVALRFAVGAHLSLLAARDVAPYGYAAVALAALVATGLSARRRSLRLIYAGLAFHVLWIVPAIYTSIVASAPLLGGGRTHVFETRPDFDGAVLAVTSMAIVRWGLRLRSRWVSLLVLLGALYPAYLILQLGKRAGLISLALIAALGLVANVRLILALPKPLLLAGLAVIVAASVVLVPRTQLYHRYVGDVATGQPTIDGTSAARRTAWDRVLRYEAATPARALFGVGFGPDFLASSQAKLVLQDEVFKDVRAPHNYLINTYARLGLVGLGLMVWLVLALARAVLPAMRLGADGTGDLEGTAAGLVVALLAVSMVGVILESPFGAVPFFWCTGLLLVSSRSRRGAAPVAVSGRSAAPPASGPAPSLARAPSLRPLPAAEPSPQLSRRSVTVVVRGAAASSAAGLVAPTIAVLPAAAEAVVTQTPPPPPETSVETSS